MYKRILSGMLCAAMILQTLALNVAAADATGTGTVNLITQEHRVDESQTEVPEYDGYLVKIKENVPTPDENSGLEYVADQLYQADSEDVIWQAYDEEEIEYVEENLQMEFLSEDQDTYYGEQETYLQNIQAQSLWNNQIDGEGVTVAVIDSGLSTGHEDLDYQQILPGTNYVDETATTEDTLGHGTMVTGIMAAIQNNQMGIAGLVDGVTIVPLKISDSNNQLSLDAVVKAIYGAVDTYHAQVINMSIGVETDSQALRDAVAYAASQNVLMIAAVGNDGDDTLLYPAAYEQVIGVGAVNNTNQVRETSQKNSSVFVTAPGEDIYTLTYGNRYTSNSGTSFAAPFVSALAAAAKSIKSEITIDEFKALLQSSSTDAGDVGYDTSYGNGIINIQEFLEDMNPELYTAKDLSIQAKTTSGKDLKNKTTEGITSTYSYEVSAPDINGYHAVYYQVSGASKTELNGTFSIENENHLVISYADMGDGVTSISYIYEKNTEEDKNTEAIEFTDSENAGGTQAEAFHDVALTSDGGYVAVGYTLGNSTDPVWNNILTSAGKYTNDGIVVKFDKDNNIQWAKNFGTNGTDILNSVAVLEDGTIVAVGQAPHVFTEGGVSTISGYLVKINPENPEDYKEIFLGGTKGDYLTAVVATENGGYAVAGYSASADSATWASKKVTTTTDGVFASFAADDTLLTATCYNPTTSYLTRIYDMAVDANGDFIAVGYHQIAKNLYNSDIVKIDGATGAILWSKSAGTTKTAAAATAAEGHKSSYMGITVLADGSYIATGITEYSGSDTGENWGLIGAQDGTVVHYGSDGSVISGTNIGVVAADVNLEGVTATADGGYVVYGSTDVAVTNNGVPYGWMNYGAQDGIIVKYNSEGSLIWSSNYGYTGNDYIYDMVFTDQGEAVAVGESASVDGQLKMENNGSTDAIVMSNLGIYDTKEVQIHYVDENGIEIMDHGTARLESEGTYEIEAPAVTGYMAVGFKIQNAADGSKDGTFSISSAGSHGLTYSSVTKATTTITYLYQSIDFDGEILTCRDGVYVDYSQGYGGSIQVQTTIVDGLITGIEVLKNSESIILGKDYMQLASEKVIPEMIVKQSTKVDVVSGATITSNGLKNAVARTLSQAQAATVVEYIQEITDNATDADLRKAAQVKAKNAYFMLDAYGRTYVTNYSVLEDSLPTKLELTADQKNGITIADTTVDVEGMSTPYQNGLSTELGYDGIVSKITFRGSEIDSSYYTQNRDGGTIELDKTLIPGVYQVTFTDDQYEDITAEFIIYSTLKASSISISRNTLKITGTTSMRNAYISAISQVSINGQVISGVTNLGNILFTSDGSINFNASVTIDGITTKLFPTGVAQSYTLNITAPGYPSYNATIGSAQLVPVTSIQLSKTTLQMNVGGVDKITGTKFPQDTTDLTEVTYTSSNASVVAVDRNTGTLKGLAAGTAVITAKVGSVQASCTVTVSHVYGGEQVITPATFTKNGTLGKVSTTGGTTLVTGTIYKISEVTLGKTSYVYNGKKQQPAVTVTDSQNKKISSSYYTVTYSSGNTNVGTYSVKVTFKGRYSGSKTLSYTIRPASTTLTLGTVSKTGVNLKWTKITGVSGYVIQYSTTSDFKSYKSITTSNVSKTLTGLNKNKKYYIRVRSYKAVKEGSATKNYYSDWSGVKSVTTKK